MSAKAFEELLTTGLDLGVKGFHHKGEWAIHEALTVLLSRTGPASVMMETFQKMHSGPCFLKWKPSVLLISD